MAPPVPNAIAVCSSRIGPEHDVITANHGVLEASGHIFEFMIEEIKIAELASRDCMFILSTAESWLWL